jgi:hypothetical protein
MNAQKWTILAVVAVAIGATALLLNRLQGGRKLGPPGLRTVRGDVYGRDDKIVGTNTIALPETVLHYTSKALPVDPLELEWLPKDTTFGRRHYTLPQGSTLDFIDLGVVLMGADRTSIHRPQVCLESQGWRIEKSELLTIPIVRPHRYELPVMRLTASGKGRNKDGSSVELKAIYAYWFVSDQRLTARHGERMWWMAADLIKTGVLPRWAYVTVLSICYPGQEEPAYARMKQFIAAAVPEFQLVAGPVTVAHRPGHFSVARVDTKN